MTIGAIAALVAALARGLWIVRKKSQARVDDGPATAVNKNVQVVGSAISRDIGLALTRRWNQLTRWLAGGAGEVFDGSWSVTVRGFGVQRPAPERPEEDTVGGSADGDDDDTSCAA